MKKTLALLLSIFALSSCNNELNVNGELRETTIIYGLLNHGDSVQYLKIYKAFLSEENTIIAASRAENLYYYDSIDVYIETISEGNSNFFQRINLDTTTLIPKNPGVFSNPYQVLYRSKPEEPLLNKNYKYQVVVQNKYTGKKTSAIINLIDVVLNHNPFKWNAANLPSIVPTFNPFSTFRMEAPSNIAQLEFIFEFYYLEKNRQTGIVTRKGPIVSTLLNTKSFKTSTLEDYELAGNAFLTAVAKNIKQDPNFVRYDDTSSIVVAVGGKELVRYNEVNAPSLSIVEERPAFTNVSNGLGLVSSRFQHRYPRVTLHRRAVDSLKFSILTSHLGFYIE